MHSTNVFIKREAVKTLPRVGLEPAHVPNNNNSNLKISLNPTPGRT